MNLQEANRFRDKLRDLQIRLDKLAERFEALEALVKTLEERTFRGRRKDESRKAIL